MSPGGNACGVQRDMGRVSAHRLDRMLVSYLVAYGDPRFGPWAPGGGRDYQPPTIPRVRRANTARSRVLEGYGGPVSRTVYLHLLRT